MSITAPARKSFLIMGPKCDARFRKTLYITHHYASPHRGQYCCDLAQFSHSCSSNALYSLGERASQSSAGSWRYSRVCCQHGTVTAPHICLGGRTLREEEVGRGDRVRTTWWYTAGDRI
ncbi:hypothetical protein EXIGLDRAFT_232547 [Exidia glandulosa HHB12029]|uniref:Uncharacterized protein n=1 Tax=Exidia glandulosa HHB12029 TaxID=1314781 RepID=A0A165E3N4_EXIGL|nr:hypothetical protein EXIGLDRAFT_232547 [Exidia glandulosa HHB12029]